MEDQLPPGFSYTGEIGRGGFAVVHRAVQDAVGRDVAIKIMNETTVSDDVARRFRRECVAVGQLSWHPHIAQVFDAGETAVGRSYMVFEYLPNGSLGDRLDQGPLDEATATEYAIQIADAVAAAHSQDVLHRDIKPDNVLLDRLGRAKLADFGIADMRDGTRTATGTVTATIFFAAPEVLSGARADQRSDVYGLAATLHTLVAGTSPFEGSQDTDIIAIIGRIATKPPPDLREVGVSGALAEVVQRGLEKTPQDRHESAAAFGRALQAAQRANGREPTPMPYTDRLVTQVETPPAATSGGAGGAATAGTAAATAAATTGPVPPPSATQPPATQPPSSEAPVSESAAAPVEPAPQSTGPSTAPQPVSASGVVQADAANEIAATQVRPATAPPTTPPPSTVAPTTPPSGGRSGPSKVLVGIGGLLAAAVIAGGLYLGFGRDSGDDTTQVAAGSLEPDVEADDPEPTEAPPEPTEPAPEPTAESAAQPTDAPAPTATAQPTPVPTPGRLATGEGITVSGNWQRVRTNCSDLGFFEDTTPAPTCHQLRVPEAWEQPSGQLIDIAFAVLPALSDEPSQPPVIYFSGGPGLRALETTELGFHDGLFDPIREDREVIVFDQRGAGASTPTLSCPEFEDTSAEETTALVRATDDCFRRLAGTGIDLRAYSAAAMAHDIRAIVESLDLDSFSILGQSYGTRAALTYMRIYGDDVDAAVFDAVRPVEYDISTARRPDFERAMQVVFDTCAQSGCGSRYPDLEGQFLAVAAQLRANPISVPITDQQSGDDATLVVSDVELAAFVHGMLYTPEQIRVIPNMIAELAQGGTSVLSQIINIRFAGLSTIEIGQLIVVNCNDELVFEDPLAVLEQRDDSIFGLLADSPTSGMSFEDCDALPPFEPDAIENERVTSAVPTLLLGGRFDPILPPAATASAAAGLPNSRSITFDWLGHGVAGNPCALELIAAFLDDPRGRLDESCVAAQPSIDYP